jgi:hypothetical protein
VRTIRKIIEMGLPIVGMVVVFGAILLPTINLNLQIQVVITLVGILMIEAGVWKLTSPFLPSERKYNALRRQVDGFIDLVRQLNNAAVEAESGEQSESSKTVPEVLDTMHASVDRMGTLAGHETPDPEV